MDEVHAAKGKSVVTLDPRTATEAELQAVLLGPTGNLRAPVLKVGKKLLVGFSEEVYRKVFA